MRTILLIATGGTIASRPTAAGGLAPAITSQELLSCVPELAEFCRIDTIQLYNLDSTNMGPEQWQGIAAAVQENYDRYDGFVITHGTDTMGYTAAALSYMIQKSPKPVVLTGSQKSIYNRDTDARNNLWRAVAYACHPDAWGVQIVFDNQVILGTRARKTRTKSFNAFSSIDYPETAMFRDRRLIQFLQRPAEYTHAVFSTALDPNVFVLRLVPGMRADIIPLLEGRYRALVLESFGVGGLPGGDDGAELAQEALNVHSEEADEVAQEDEQREHRKEQVIRQRCAVAGHAVVEVAAHEQRRAAKKPVVHHALEQIPLTSALFILHEAL